MQITFESFSLRVICFLLFVFCHFSSKAQDTSFVTSGNPVIRHKFTDDPAAMVYNGKVYLYTGHDEAPPQRNGYEMHEWLVYSSSDMVTWTEHAVPLKVKDFAWAKADAWASQVVERNGKFYWYVAVEHATIEGKAIGVAVAENPLGPFRDARGSAVVTNDMTKAATIRWDDIDPTVYIDEKGQAWLFWGNTACYYAKLKDNMIELDGEIKTIALPKFTEAPWIHKRNGWYYLSYAYEFPEKTAYAMSRSLEGPATAIPTTRPSSSSRENGILSIIMVRWCPMQPAFTAPFALIISIITMMAP